MNRNVSYNQLRGKKTNFLSNRWNSGNIYHVASVARDIISDSFHNNRPQSCSKWSRKMQGFFFARNNKKLLLLLLLLLFFLSFPRPAPLILQSPSVEISRRLGTNMPVVNTRCPMAEVLISPFLDNIFL